MVLNTAVQTIVASLPTFHLVSFSTLLGSQLYQTFIVTKVAFKNLPRGPYVNFQKHIFPVYFHGQALLLLLSAVTFPPYGPVSLVQHNSDWVPFTVSGVVSALNLLVFGPRTKRLMLNRAEQGEHGSLVDRFGPKKLADKTRDAGQGDKPREPESHDAGPQEEILHRARHVYSSELGRPGCSSLVHVEAGLSPAVSRCLSVMRYSQLELDGS